jgi:hypothetical protein
MGRVSLDLVGRAAWRMASYGLRCLHRDLHQRWWDLEIELRKGEAVGAALERTEGRTLYPGEGEAFVSEALALGIWWMRAREDGARVLVIPSDRYWRDLPWTRTRRTKAPARRSRARASSLVQLATVCPQSGSNDVA